MDTDDLIREHISSLAQALGVIHSPVNRFQISESLMGDLYYVELLRECELRVQADKEKG